MTLDAELAQRYGTPLYIYDLDRVLAARSDLRAALPEEFELFYSFKANPHPDLARALREGGEGEACRAEVCSTGELSSAFAAGFPAAEILYGGPGKTTGELEAAIGAGVRTFSTESYGDLARVGAVAERHGTVADCLLRINVVASGTSTSIRMTGTPSQFGFDAETLPGLMPQLRAVSGIRLTGLHFFPLSNSREEAGLISEFQRSIVTAAELGDDLGLPIDLLDLGGGFAAPYAVPGSRPSYDKLRLELGNALDVHFPGWRRGGPRVACESGRYLVGDSGRLVTAVTNVKQSRRRKFVILDAGINTLGGMAGLGRLMPLEVLPDPDGTDGTEVASLVGPLCTPGDILGRDLDVRELSVGDLVTVPNIGAYGVSASLLAFLSRPAPAEVVVRGDVGGDPGVVSVSRLEVNRAYTR